MQKFLVTCRDWPKQRIIFSQKKLESNTQVLLNNHLEDIIFVCGEFLYNHQDPEIQKLKEAKVSVDRRLLCQDHQSSSVYKTLKSEDPVVCAWFLNPLSDDRSTKFWDLSERYNTVIPNCGSATCLISSSGKDGGFITAYPKKKRKGSELSLPNPRRRGLNQQEQQKQ